MTEEQQKIERHISFSQIQLYNDFCAYFYRLKYIDGLFPREENLFSMFGTTIHSCAEALIAEPEYDVKKNFDEKFMEGLRSLPDSERKKFKEEKNYYDLALSMKKEGPSLVQEAIAQLKISFPTYRVLKTEQELNIKISDGMFFRGFVDLILVDEKAEKFIIADWKTTSWGWDAKQKGSKWKIYQLSYYKHFISKELGIPLENIDTYFILVKRTAKKERIEAFEVSNGEKRVSNALKVLDDTLRNIEQKNFPKNKSSCEKCLANNVYCFPNPMMPRKQETKQIIP